MKTSDFFNWIRRSQIVRSDQRWLGGVCSGLANRLGWDVALVRADGGSCADGRRFICVSVGMDSFAKYEWGNSRGGFIKRPRRR